MPVECQCKTCSETFASNLIIKLFKRFIYPRILFIHNSVHCYTGYCLSIPLLHICRFIVSSVVRFSCCIIFFTSLSHFIPDLYVSWFTYLSIDNPNLIKHTRENIERQNISEFLLKYHVFIQIFPFFPILCHLPFISGNFHFVCYIIKLRGERILHAYCQWRPFWAFVDNKSVFFGI
jgi:hypothetical protein